MGYLKEGDGVWSNVNQKNSALHIVKRGSVAVGKGMLSITVGAIASVDLTKVFTDLTRDSNGVPTHYLNGNDPVTGAVFFGGLIGFSILTDRLLNKAAKWIGKKESKKA